MSKFHELMMKKRGIPSRYQEVEYIESTETQYIDSLLVPKTTHKFSVKFSNGYLRNSVVFGSRTSGNYASSLNQIFLNITHTDVLYLYNILNIVY